MSIDGFVLHQDDNVATLVNSASQGDAITLRGYRKNAIVAMSEIPNGHKVALHDLSTGAEVIKYGYVVGRMIKDVRQGEHVHTQNMQSNRGRGDLLRSSQQG